MKKQMLGSIAALLCAGLVAAMPDMGVAQSATPWSTFHAGGTRSGYSAVAGPTGPSAVHTWNLPRPIESSAVVDANGVSYVGDDDKNVYALDPNHIDLSKNFGAKWKFATNGLVLGSGTLSADGKVLFIGSNDGNIYAVDTATGTQKWAFDIGGPVHAAPLLSIDGSQLFVNSVNGVVWSVNPADGSKLAGPLKTGVTIPGSLALSPDGATLYMALFSGVMYAVPAVGGDALKSVTTTYYLDGPAVSTPAVDGNGNIYVSTTKGSLTSYAPGSGQARWSFIVPSHTPALSTPAIGNGIVVFGDGDQNLYALSQSSGQPVWNAYAHTNGSIGSSAAISGNGIVYVGSDDGNIYAYSASTGSQLWARATGASVSASPAIGPDGSLWIGSQVGIMYQIKDVGGPPVNPTSGPTSTAGPTSTPGPTSTALPTSSPPPPGPITIKLKKKVKSGSRQVISVTTTPNTSVHFRINYANGDTQFHAMMSDPSGVAVYSYKQGSSKTTHNKFVATVIVRVGNGAAVRLQTVHYTVAFGNIDVSVEPRAQAVGKKIDVFVHTAVGKRISAQIRYPSGSQMVLHGHTGPKGIAHMRFTVPRGKTLGTHRTVLVTGRLQSGNPGYYSSTTFKIK